MASRERHRVLVVDNYDSFTYNLVQCMTTITGVHPLVVYNNTDFDLIRRLMNQRIVHSAILSPGPGRPDVAKDFGVCKQILEEASIPVLGICLGVQGMSTVFGGSVKHAEEPMHGRLTAVRHDSQGIFKDIPQDFKAVRYNSLVVDEEDLPHCLKVTARSLQDRAIMGIRHESRPIYGVQFHPESICTDFGRQLLTNFFHLASSSALLFHPIPQRLTLCSDDLSEIPCSVPSLTLERSHTPSSINSSSPTHCDVDSGTASPNPAFTPNMPRSFSVVASRIAWIDPQDCFDRLFQHREHTFWLESSKVEEQLSRFSFMGSCLDGPLSSSISFDASKRIVSTKNAESTVTRSHLREDETFFDWLNSFMSQYQCPNTECFDAETQARLHLPFDFNCGLVGYFGYEMKSECMTRVPNKHNSEYPDANLLLADRIIAFDHLEHTAFIVCLTSDALLPNSQQWISTIKNSLDCGRHQPLGTDRSSRCDTSAAFELRADQSAYLKNIRQCKRQILDGESYELCLTTQIKSKQVLDPLALYRLLRQTNPSPHAAFLRFGPKLSVVCCSPERFMKVDTQGVVECKPIKGTAPRGATEEEDERLRHELASGEKEFSENLMIVDLIRNDIGRVATAGSVTVPHLMRVESYATVHQLVTTVRGVLRPEVSSVHCLHALFPPGSMTGAPKVRSVAILEDLERGPRGVYSGCIGYIACGGAMDMNVVIRTAVVTPSDISIGAGGAIVHMSEEQEEFDEMLLKGKALMSAVNVLVGSQAEPEVRGADGKLTSAQFRHGAVLSGDTGNAQQSTVNDAGNHAPLHGSPSQPTVSLRC